MVQQPNNVGRMHCNIHAYYKSNKYLCAEDFRVPKVMAPMKGVLQSSGLDPASSRTYWKALCLPPDCLVKSCAPDVVIDGYKKSGIWPVDNNAIMSGWSGWSKLNSTVEKSATFLSSMTVPGKRTTAPSITGDAYGQIIRR